MRPTMLKLVRINICIGMLMALSELHAQVQYIIQGPTEVTEGSTHNYPLVSPTTSLPMGVSEDTSDWDFWWEIDAGTLDDLYAFGGISGVPMLFGYDIQEVGVTFDTEGAVYLIVDAQELWGDGFWDELEINVNPAIPDTPLMPKMIDGDCTNVLLQKSGKSPPEVSWHWQGTNSSGTDFSAYSNSALFNFQVTASGTYYLRARNYSSREWSINSSAIQVTLGELGCTVINDPDAVLDNKNYIHTITPRIKINNVSSLSDNEKIESVAYFDGLGRPKQRIGIRAGGQNQDIITHIEYDEFGRQTKDYLPYVASANGGLYIVDALTPTNSFYNITKYENTTNPYSEKELEASPLNRVLKQAAPGNDWKLGNGHEIEFGYDPNIANEVKNYEVTLLYAYTPSLQLNGYYAANELYKTVTYDENHTSGTTHSIEEFKDKQGRVVLKRTYATVGSSSTIEAYDTYYVYDMYGNLTYVLPPKMEASTATITTITSQLGDLGYQYKYDHRNRLVEKKIPGKGWEYIIYNKLDQPIMTQDAIQYEKSPKEWLFTKYDAFGRLAYTGMIKNSSSRSFLQAEADALHALNPSYVTKNNYSANSIAGTTIYYNDGAYPTTSTITTTTIAEIQIINYYDNYTFDKESGNSETSYGITPTTNAKGLATGSKVRVLDTNDWITTVMYYDEKANPIYVYSSNAYLGTTDKTKSKYDFTGIVEETNTTHTKSSTTITTDDVFSYDNMNRLTQQTQAINNATTPEVIVANIYDDLGQLTSKGVGGSTQRLQTVDYQYNIRGWLKQINDVNSLGTDLFGFEIKYNDPTSGTALFNGNISQTNWNSDSTNATSNPISNNYAYTYDALNRIINGENLSNDNYDLNSVTYDLNGNIKTLSREGHTNAAITTFGTMDDLSYFYSGNQLLSVSDSSLKTQGFNDGNTSGNDYSYDTNGNMITDANKGIININYNHLNLPSQVTFAADKYIDYIYDASGIKLKKIVTDQTAITKTSYAGNYIYEEAAGVEELKFFNQPEGYIEPDGSNGYNYIYQYKDHLGNIRLSYTDVSLTSTPSLEIVEENNYYPFGLKHKGYNNNQVGRDHKFEFQGQEIQDELGLNWISFKWRNHDPAIGRFMSIDPLAEGYVYNSPYNFSENRVIDGVELEGLEYVHYQAVDIPVGGTRTYKSKKPNQYTSWVSKGLAKLGVNIEPFKVYVVNYKGKGYLFSGDDYDSMIIAQPEDFEGRHTLEGIEALQQVIGVVGDLLVPKPKSAKSNAVVDVTANAVDKANEFKNGTASANPEDESSEKTEEKNEKKSENKSESNSENKEEDKKEND